MQSKHDNNNPGSSLLLVFVILLSIFILVSFRRHSWSVHICLMKMGHRYREREESLILSFPSLDVLHYMFRW